MSSSSIAPFKQYYPAQDRMSAEQRSFYQRLHRDLHNGTFPRVEGNISYLFVFVYSIIDRYKTSDLATLRRELLALAEAYHYEPKFPDYCRQWAYESFLAEGNYHEYLNLTEPENPFVTQTHFANQRCNVFYHVGTAPTGTDLVQLFGLRPTRAVQKYSGALRDSLESVVAREQAAHGSFLDRMLRDPAVSQVYGNTLFSGVPYQKPEFKFPVHCFYVHRPTAQHICDLLRGAENVVRQGVGLPRVGEGWVAETALYQAIRSAFPETRAVQHGQPDWLGRQHLDVWLPDWRLAVEFHGQQHFTPVDFFGGEPALQNTRERDSRKERLCREHGVMLLVATASDPHESVISRIRECRQRQTKHGAA
jgi:hypothetical protein